MGFHPPKHPTQKGYRLAKRNMYDAIIIGAGLGGLFAGAKLAKEGLKVAVLEQHFIPGGYATTFKRKDFTFDVGLHAIDSLDQKHSATWNLFNEFDIFNHVNFLTLPEFYTYQRGHLKIPISANSKENILLLEKIFPQHKNEIEFFFKTLLGLRREVLTVPSSFPKMLLNGPLLFYKYPHILKNFKKCAGEFMTRLFSNDDLELALAANSGFFHDDPYSYSMLHFGGAQGSYFTGGASYIQGGSQQLSDYLCRYIIEHGGSIKLRSKAHRIITKHNHVNGVEYYQTHDIYPQTLLSDSVIVNMAIPTVLQNMLGHDVAPKLRAQTKEYELSHSIYAIYLGLKKPLKELGNESYSTFITHPTLTSLRDFARYNKTTNFNLKTMSLVDYSQVDSQLTSPRKGVASIFVIDEIDHWEHLEKAEYQEEKMRTARILIDRVDKIIPHFKKNIELIEVGTPLTMRRYTNNPRGVVYGYAQSPWQVPLHRVQPGREPGTGPVAGDACGGSNGPIGSRGVCGGRYQLPGQ